MSDDFTPFYEAEFGPVYDAAFAFCRDRELARDATQEAFARAYARWPRLRRETWAGGWVMTTTLNYCRRELKKTMRRGDAPLLEVNASVLPADSTRVDLVSALMGLPPRQREITILHYVGDLPISVVATLTSLSEGAVKSHLYHARAYLRRAYRDNQD